MASAGSLFYRSLLWQGVPDFIPELTDSFLNQIFLMIHEVCLMTVLIANKAFFRE